ncbi:putative transcriptional regulatory protein YkoG [Halolactibacillus alkaliphilus]|uniref:Putative transcriptional regulatory protein YkoG n=2 Tax=Halolactibacillus alkaliphilus TaxID=442899 RepID=A0A511X3U7_9BACI|nr:putative transcriptional regulatory protein YkoG [Halolactibacillus alkaliphilus]GGN74355.1 putative transcriptional regulatory protein YkoG [Halolactibacillus alkaliphilus]SFP01240.1 DNA-binding response regulator, OmpR family, contains REC and winged-helix (wHTH) domain [Halolactibacillus alkaliphilus]
MTILVVEDEVKLARALQLELEFEGYTVRLCHDGKEALKLILEETFELIILDVMLPSLSGMDILRRLRKENERIPVIMLTARDQIYDKVSGLDYGANDYITKPFEIEELLARIRVQLRLTENVIHEDEKNLLLIKDIKINLSTYEVTRANQPVELTKREFELLVFLVKNKNHVLSRDQLLTEVWGYDYMGETNVVDVYVRYLRQKLDYELIETVRGVGYMVRSE